ADPERRKRTPDIRDGCEVGAGDGPPLLRGREPDRPTNLAAGSAPRAQNSGQNDCRGPVATGRTILLLVHFLLFFLLLFFLLLFLVLFQVAGLDDFDLGAFFQFFLRRHLDNVAGHRLRRRRGDRRRIRGFGGRREGNQFHLENQRFIRSDLPGTALAVGQFGWDDHL